MAILRKPSIGYKSEELSPPLKGGRPNRKNGYIHLQAPSIQLQAPSKYEQSKRQFTAGVKGLFVCALADFTRWLQDDGAELYRSLKECKRELTAAKRNRTKDKKAIVAEAESALDDAVHQIAESYSFGVRELDLTWHGEFKKNNAAHRREQLRKGGDVLTHLRWSRAATTKAEALFFWGKYNRLTLSDFYVRLLLVDSNPKPQSITLDVLAECANLKELAFNYTRKLIDTLKVEPTYRNLPTMTKDEVFAFASRSTNTTQRKKSAQALVNRHEGLAMFADSFWTKLYIPKPPKILAQIDEILRPFKRLSADLGRVAQGVDRRLHQLGETPPPTIEGSIYKKAVNGGTIQ